LSLGLHSLSQKKGAVYSLILLIAVVALVVGILYVSGVTTTNPQSFTPRWVQASAANASINITITNSAGENMRRADITRPGTVGSIDCGVNLPGTWVCTKTSTTIIKFTDSTGVAAGSSVSFNLNVTSPTAGGNHSFQVDTFNSGDANGTTTNINLSTDGDSPYVTLVNVTDGTNVLAATNGLYFLSNTTRGLIFVINATDNASGIGRVALYYNLSGYGGVGIVSIPDHRGTNGTNVSSVVASNASYGTANLFNVTLNDYTLKNGSTFAFTILVNDTVGNGNVSNSSNSTAVSTFAYNFTIDTVPPQFVDILVSNQSSLNAVNSIRAINASATFGSTSKYIVNSTVLLNISALVRGDDGGSGTVRANILNRSSSRVNMSLLTGTNGSASQQTTWSLNTSNLNITDLVTGFSGDRQYNVSVHVYDNVSNVNNTYNYVVEVDDTPPTGSVTTNITQDGKLSEANATLNIATNATFNITLTTSNNIDNTTKNISVFGNKGFIFNLTYLSGSPSGTSSWVIAVGNDTGAGSLTNITTANLSRLCDLTANDNSQCNLRFNFSDVLGRYNDTINLTVYVDAIPPNVSIASPVSFTTNYSTTVMINVSVNDSIGPIRNVSYRWRNSTAFAGSEGTQAGGNNVSNWIPLTFNSGSNAVANTQGYWNATLTISNLLDGNYSIELNATDSAARQNATIFIGNIIFDSTRPYNISIKSPAANSFHKDNATFTGWTTTNITAVANETRDSFTNSTQSGLLNVSFRLENSTVNFSWVPANIGILQALANGRLYSPDRFNITHIDGQTTNASNGNFTLRLNVTDTAGNQNTSVTINVTIDTIPPSAISFVLPTIPANKTGNFSVNVTALDSNVGTVQFRWVNDSSAAVLLSRRGEWTPMSSLNLTLFNGTFTNLTDNYMSFLDGNYSIEANVTDKAGWNLTTFIQIILDRTSPAVQLVSSAGNSIPPNSILNSSFVVNVTVNDTGNWNMNLGNINTTNLNGSPSFSLINRSSSTISSNATIMKAPDLSPGGNYSNATFTFSQVPNGVYDINITTNDTAGNVNTTIIANITLDNTAPSVRVINTSPTPGAGNSVSGTIVINASITDNIYFGPNGIDNQSVVVTFVNLTPLTNRSFRMTRNNDGKLDLWNVSVNTANLVDGEYQVYVNTTDKAGNRNATESITITVQNGLGVNTLYNLSFLNGFVSGKTNTISSRSPILTINTSSSATCKYSLDPLSRPLNYSVLPSTTTGTGLFHNGTLGNSVLDGAHTVDWLCQDSQGYFVPQTNTSLSVSSGTFTFDTTSNWNVTIPGQTDASSAGTYFQPATSGQPSGWVSFVLATGPLASSTLASATGGYNVTNVLASLMAGTAAGNFTRIYAYTASTNSWETFIVGSSGNTFINFTNQTTYWINVTAIERIEVS